MDAVVAPRPAHDAPGHPRLIGLAVATLIALGVLAAELVVFGTSIMLLSLLVAPYLGWCLGPDAAASRRPARTVLEIAGISVIYGALLVAVAGQTGPYVVWDGPWDRAVDVIGIAIIGLVIFGLPGLVLTSGCAMAWYAAVRRLSTIGRSESAR